MDTPARLPNALCIPGVCAFPPAGMPRFPGMLDNPQRGGGSNPAHWRYDACAELTAFAESSAKTANEKRLGGKHKRRAGGHRTEAKSQRAVPGVLHGQSLRDAEADGCEAQVERAATSSPRGAVDDDLRRALDVYVTGTESEPELHSTSTKPEALIRPLEELLH